VSSIQDEIRRSEEALHDHGLDVILLEARGMSARQTAEMLGDAPRTIAYWVADLKRKDLPA